MKKIITAVVLCLITTMVMGKEGRAFSIQTNSLNWLIGNINVGVEIPAGEKLTVTPFVSYFPYNVTNFIPVFGETDGKMIYYGGDIRNYFNGSSNGGYIGIGAADIYTTDGKVKHHGIFEGISKTRENEIIKGYHIPLIDLQLGYKIKIGKDFFISNGIVGGVSWIVEDKERSKPIYWYGADLLKMGIDF